MTYSAIATAWPSGIEVWCNLPGKYVTIVRDYSSQAGHNYKVTLCDVAIFGDVDGDVGYEPTPLVLEASYTIKVNEPLNFIISHVTTDFMNIEVILKQTS